MQTEQSQEIADLVVALAKVQQSLRPAIKDATNPHLKSKYADLAAVNAAAQPELGKEGLAVIQTAEEGADGSTFLATTLAHTSGQWIRGRLRVEVQPSKGLNLSQSQGLALTYARRYSLAAILGVVTEDDDGHGAGDPGQPRQKRQPVHGMNAKQRQQFAAKLDTLKLDHGIDLVEQVCLARNGVDCATLAASIPTPEEAKEVYEDLVSHIEAEAERLGKEAETA